MIDYQKLLKSLSDYGIDAEGMVRFAIAIGPEDVHEDVIIAPIWQPDALPGLGSARFLQATESNQIKCWDMEIAGRPVTYLNTGIGAAMAMETVLSLSQSPCKRILFIGSCGALVSGYHLGDFVVPSFSFSGEGASRYILGDSLAQSDPFASRGLPDDALSAHLQAAAEGVMQGGGARLHRANNYSTDSILTEYIHLDEILSLGAETVEMETSAVFHAAKLVGIEAAALFVVSDSLADRMTLHGGRSEEMVRQYHDSRSSLYPAIIKAFYAGL